MYQNILVAYDGSEAAQHALASAARLAEAIGGTLHVCKVLEVTAPMMAPGAGIALLDLPKSEAEVAAESTSLAAEVAEQLAPLNQTAASALAVTGVPVRRLLERAEIVDADLIVAGRRGLGALGSLALGSVSLGLAHGAPCAVLTVA